jgi:hypothetical protein
LIGRAKAVHAEIYRSSGNGRLRLPPTYIALVEVAHAQLDRMAATQLTQTGRVGLC